MPNSWPITPPCPADVKKTGPDLMYRVIKAGTGKTPDHRRPGQSSRTPVTRRGRLAGKTAWATTPPSPTWSTGGVLIAGRKDWGILLAGRRYGRGT